MAWLSSDDPYGRVPDNFSLYGGLGRLCEFTTNAFTLAPLPKPYQQSVRPCLVAR
jgi:hypothetical protein